MTPDFRALCAEAFSLFNGYDSGQRVDWDSWKERARAALANEPAVPEGREPVAVIGEFSDKRPTVMEIIELSSETEAAGLGQVDFARAVLARWGNLKARVTSSTPADGEVAELVARLSAIRNDYGLRHSADCQRAAELLQREVLVPVSVSERLPGPEDCDAEGRCWWWSAETVERVGCWMLSRGTGAEMCWLPAHALPVPEVGQ